MEARDALALWVSEGQIDAALAEQLRSTLAANEEPERANKLIWVLASIGAVLIGGGLLLFLAGQWDQSSPVRRIALLLAIWLLTVIAAAAADRQQLTTTARGLWLLSSIAVGVNIFLIGQVFNLPLNYWQGTLLWMIATLATGWASPSGAQGWLAVPLGILTLGWISTPSAQFFDQGAFLWDSAGILPMLPLIGLGLVGMALLVRNTDFGWLQRPASFFGALLVAVPIIASTFHPDSFAWFFRIDFSVLHVLIGLGTLAIVAAVWHREPTTPLVVAFAAVAVLLIGLLPQTSGASRLYDESSSWLASSFIDSALLFGVYTAIIFGLSVATILAGEHYCIRGLVNVGFAMVGVLLAGVYLGRIAGELPTALAVIGGGLLLIGGAIFLERKRRDLTAEVQAAVQATVAP